MAEQANIAPPEAAAPSASSTPKSDRPPENPAETKKRLLSVVAEKLKCLLGTPIHQIRSVLQKPGMASVLRSRKALIVFGSVLLVIVGGYAAWDLLPTSNPKEDSGELAETPAGQPSAPTDEAESPEAATKPVVTAKASIDGLSETELSVLAGAAEQEGRNEDAIRCWSEVLKRLGPDKETERSLAFERLGRLERLSGRTRNAELMEQNAERLLKESRGIAAMVDRAQAALRKGETSLARKEIHQFLLVQNDLAPEQAMEVRRALETLSEAWSLEWTAKGRAIPQNAQEPRLRFEAKP